jgi:hypothetical protein
VAGIHAVYNTASSMIILTLLLCCSQCGVSSTAAGLAGSRAAACNKPVATNLPAVVHALVPCWCVHACRYHTTASVSYAVSLLYYREGCSTWPQRHRSAAWCSATPIGQSTTTHSFTANRTGRLPAQPAASAATQNPTASVQQP